MAQVSIPYADSHGTLSVEVSLNHAADVFLVDSINFQNSRTGKVLSILVDTTPRHL